MSRVHREWNRVKAMAPHLKEEDFVAVEDDGVVHYVHDDGSDGIFVLACNHDRGAIPVLNEKKVSCIRCLAQEKS